MNAPDARPCASPCREPVPQAAWRALLAARRAVVALLAPWRAVVALLVAWSAAPGALAHQASDAYLRAGTDAQGRLALQIDVALRDLDVVLDLDADADGKLQWGEVRRRAADITEHVAAHLAMTPAACALHGDPAALALDRKADGVYAVLHLRSDCTAAQQPSLAYNLFRGVDPTHRGLLLVLDHQGQPAAPLRGLTPGGDPVRLAIGAAGATGAQSDAPGFFLVGMHHILIGADHVLFLVCLLLPLALGRRPDGSHARGRTLWLPLLSLVTAFTVAHSITLGLAAWRVVSVSPRVIEPLIALTIAGAAADNLWPVLGKRRVLAAFAFGLVHGFGFAGPLLELGLAPWAMAKALLQFNLGVEAGQLCVVVLAIALLTPLRGRPHAMGWMRGGSVVAGLVALVWIGERLLNFKVLPV